MTKGITEKEPDPRVVYAEFIDLPHHVSASRPHMPLYDRAAQFAPFAALTGYEDMIIEEARQVDTQTELGEYELEIINRKINRIMELLESGVHPEVSVTYFLPDKKKAGGQYITTGERIYSVDTIEKKLILTRTVGIGKVRAAIEIGKIADIQGEGLDEEEYGDEIPTAL